MFSRFVNSTSRKASLPTRIPIPTPQSTASDSSPSSVASFSTSFSNSQPLLSTSVFSSSISTSSANSQNNNNNNSIQLLQELREELLQSNSDILSLFAHNNSNQQRKDESYEQESENHFRKVSKHFHLCKRVIAFHQKTTQQLQRQRRQDLQRMNANSNGNKNSDVISNDIIMLHEDLTSTIELLIRKLLLFREKAQPIDFESAGYLREIVTQDSVVSDLSVLKPIALGVFSSQLSTPEDLLIMVEGLRTYFSGGSNNNNNNTENNNNNNNNNNEAMVLSDQDRLDISFLVRLAKDRLKEQLSISRSKLFSETEQFTIVKSFLALFPLILHATFSESAELLLEVSKLYQEEFFSAVTDSKRVKPFYLAVGIKQIFYCASVLARRPSCSTIAKPILISILQTQGETMMKSSVFHNNNNNNNNNNIKSETEDTNYKTHLELAMFHALIAFYVLNEPQLLLALNSSNTLVNNNNNNNNKNSQQQQHWTVSWALAQTGKVNEALDALFIVAQSRNPKGWTGVPARVRNVIQSIGSKLETKEQVFKWCQAISEMKCPSMRSDADNIAPALQMVDRISEQNRAAVLELSKILALNGVFQSDALKIVQYFLISVKNGSNSFSMRDREELVSEMVSLWSQVTADGSFFARAKAQDNKMQAFILDSRLLEFFLFDHQQLQLSTSSSLDAAAITPPAWLRHIAKYPNLLLQGSLPNKHLLTTIQDRLEMAVLMEKSISYLPLVKSLLQLVNHTTVTSSNSDNNNSNDESPLVWSCQVCDSSNTYIYSTCGNDSCKAARYAPIQCNVCHFINPAHSTSCKVCSTVWSGLRGNFTLRPFSKWKCSGCGESQHNVPSSSVTSGIRCEKCCGMTGPLVEFIELQNINATSRNFYVCTSCRKSPNEGDVISSQNPVCTEEKCQGGTLIPVSAETKKQDENSATRLLSWSCLHCGEQNQPWRERCAKCVQVPKMPTSISRCCCCCATSNERSQEQLEEDLSTIELVERMSLSSASLLLGGYWTCSCGSLKKNSTVDDRTCCSCNGSVELHCVKLFTTSIQAQKTLLSLIANRQLTMLNDKDLKHKKKQSEEAIRKQLEEMVFCSSCKTQNREMEFLKENINAATFSDNAATKLFESIKQQQQQQLNNNETMSTTNSRNHLGDFCTSCGSSLPLCNVLSHVQQELFAQSKFFSAQASASASQQNQQFNVNDEDLLFLQQHRKLNNNNVYNNNNNNNQPNQSTSTEEYFMDSVFQLESLRHNLAHMKALLEVNDSKVESSLLQKNVKSEKKDDEGSSIRFSISPSIGLAHRLIRICADRSIALENYLAIVAGSSASSSENESDHKKQLLRQLASLSQIVSSLCAQRWNVMSDSYTRGSLAAAVRVLMSIQRLSNSSTSSSSASPLPIQFLLEDQRRCKWCLGRHPESMCPNNMDLVNFSPTWTCNDCGEVANDIREGAQRYICKSCLGVRPEVLAMDDDSLWAEVWECPQCKRATPMIEDNCIFCPYIRTSEEDREEIKMFSTSDAQENSLQVADHDSFSSTNQQMQQPRVTTTLPFFPARCGLCGEVHFEALCPICSSTSATTNSVQNAYGVVSRIYHPQQRQQQETKNPQSSSSSSSSQEQQKSSKSNNNNFVVAMIQPHGTAGRNSMVLLPSSALPQDGSSRQRILSVGSFVRFDAQRSLISLHPHERSKTGNNNSVDAGIVSFSPNRESANSTSALCVTKISAVS